MTEIKFNHDTTMSRKDLEAIISMIPGGARILDLGCGTGRLLHSIASLRHASVMGVEMDQEKVIQCMGEGVPVIHSNLDDGLTEFCDGSFDFVILSQTLQAVKRPDLLLDDMLRVGKTGIVSFLNFGFWRARWQVLLGAMPVTPALPMEWYDTTNIHLATIVDFRNLCRKKNIRILKEIPLNQFGGIFTGSLSRLWPNLFSNTCVFIIEK